MPSIAKNYALLENIPLPWYYTLVKIENLTMEQDILTQFAHHDIVIIRFPDSQSQAGTETTHCVSEVLHSRLGCKKYFRPDGT